MFGRHPFFWLRAPAVEPAEGGGPTDASLVAAAKSGDRAAFTLLVNRYRSRVHGMVVNMIRNEADAWDLTQEVFLKAWLALGKFEGRSSFFTWLYRIAHNVTYDWLRKKRPETATEFDEDWQSSHLAPEADSLLDAGESPAAGLDRADLRAALDAAMEKLTPEHRQVILLKEVQDLKYQEIADVMDCSIGTVMSRLFYARKKLQELLRPAYDEFRRGGNE
ncbi:MAG: RNA polymerase sigma factor [Verrucomicrobiales bacterium]